MTKEAKLSKHKNQNTEHDSQGVGVEVKIKLFNIGHQHILKNLW